MDGIVSTIRKASDQKSLERLARKLLESKKAVMKVIGTVDGALQVLNPEQHTVGMVWLLYYKSQTELTDQQSFFLQVRALCLAADINQVALCRKQFSSIVRKMTEAATLLEAFLAAVDPLRKAVALLQGADGHELTSAHADLVLMCLRAKCYVAAQPVVAKPIYSVNKQSGITPLDYLHYFYYAGMINIGLKKYPEAFECFQLALTIPTLHVSAVQVAALKKYILVSLLAFGERVSLPNSISRAVRAAEKEVMPYTQLAVTFVTGDSKGLRSTLTEHQETFVTDVNLGLVKQVEQCLVRLNIRKLTNTYVTVSLEAIAQQANLATPKEAEKEIVTMVAKNEIYARISQKDGMMSFLENPEEYDTAEMLQSLDGKIRQVIDMQHRLEELDTALELNPVYVTKSMPPESSKNGGAAGDLFMGGMGMGHGGMGLPMGMGGMSDIDRALAASMVEQ